MSNTNCKGPHTINAANVGSTRDLISQKKKCIETIDCKADETAVHCCDPALSVLVMLVSRNVFHVVSALQSIASIHFFWLIRSLLDPTLAAFIVCGPLQFVLLNQEFSDRRSSQILYAAFLKHGTGHAFECLGCLCPATFIFCLSRHQH